MRPVWSDWKDQLIVIKVEVVPGIRSKSFDPDSFSQKLVRVILKKDDNDAKGESNLCALKLPPSWAEESPAVSL